jgi:hypothetical protein
MTTSPPPPGPWGAHPGPPTYGQPMPGHPGQGPVPPGYQQPWYPPPGPPHKGGTTKWLILAALVAVVAVAVAVIVVVLHSGSGAGSKSSSTSTSASDIASANDTGPVTVITQDPSCAAWTPIIDTLAAAEKQSGWDKRDASIPASAWNAEQRQQFQAAGAAMVKAADQTVALAKLTPHRVMRELYEQSIAYSHAYSDSLANYTPADEYLALAANAAGGAVGAICDAISYGSAAARGPLVAAPAPPTQTAPPNDPAKAQRLLTASNAVCKDWADDGSQFNAATADWQKTDPSTPASQWSPAQKALNDTVGPLISASATKFEQLGRRSDNPTLEDFAVLTAQYGRAYVQGLPTYVPGDRYLFTTTSFSSGVVRAACQAVGS